MYWLRQVSLMTTGKEKRNQKCIGWVRFLYRARLCWFCISFFSPFSTSKPTEGAFVLISWRNILFISCHLYRFSNFLSENCFNNFLPGFLSNSTFDLSPIMHTEKKIRKFMTQDQDIFVQKKIFSTTLNNVFHCDERVQ